MTLRGRSVSNSVRCNRSLTFVRTRVRCFLWCNLGSPSAKPIQSSVWSSAQAFTPLSPTGLHLSPADLFTHICRGLPTFITFPLHSVCQLIASLMCTLHRTLQQSRFEAGNVSTPFRRRRWEEKWDRNFMKNPYFKEIGSRQRGEKVIRTPAGRIQVRKKLCYTVYANTYKHLFIRYPAGVSVSKL